VLAVAAGLAVACGSSSHGDDDDAGGLSGQGGVTPGTPGGNGGGGTSSGKGGAASGRGGAASAGTGGDTSGAPGDGEAGSDATNGGETASSGGTSGSGTSGTSGGGTSGVGGTNAAGGSGGAGPRPPFAPKVRCDTPRWLTSVEPPLAATDPLAVTNGLGHFMVTWLTSEEVNATETWGNGVVSLAGGEPDANQLESDAGQGTNTHTGQLAMGRTGDALWLQNPGNLGSSDMTTLRRWDQANLEWSGPHVVEGMRTFGMRATFLDDHDILVVGSIGDQLSALTYDHASATWSDPTPLGSLGSSLPNWGATHVAVAADGEGNAAVVWANGAASGARVMRAREWVGEALPLSADTMIQDFWDVAIIPAGGGNFEVVTGPQDQTRGVIMQSRTLGYTTESGTVLGEIVEMGSLPEITYVGAGQPITALRDRDGDLTVGSVFWTAYPEFWLFRRVNGGWENPLRLASGIIVANNNIGMGLRSIALDSGGHALAVIANEDDELVLREVEHGASTWTEGIRIDTTDFRFNRRGVSLVLDGDDPVIFFSADDALGTSGNVAWTTCHD